MFSVVKCVNGNFAVVSEHSDFSGAKQSYWNTCITLENAQDVIKGQVALLNEYLLVEQGFTQTITHTPAEPEPTEE